LSLFQEGRHPTNETSLHFEASKRGEFPTHLRLGAQICGVIYIPKIIKLFCQMIPAGAIKIATDEIDQNSRDLIFILRKI
jgi:hypothetical protein